MRVGRRGAAVRCSTSVGAACLMLLAAAALSGCGTRSTSPAAGTFTPATRGVLTVATSDVPSPGFWEGTPSHLTGGFEYELALALADRFDLRSVRIKIVTFHRVVAGDLDGADLALDLITPTDARKEHLDFSTPYLNEAPTVVVRSGTSIPDLATAQDLQWGAIRSTTFVDLIDDLVAPDDPVRIYDDQHAETNALLRGQIDAAMYDLPAAVAIADDSHGRLDAVAQLPKPENIAAALPEGSDNAQAVDSAMRAFIADGTVHDLLEEWVGSDAANASKSIPLLHTTLS